MSNMGKITTAGAVEKYPLPASGGARSPSPRDPTEACGSPRTPVTGSGRSPPTGRSPSTRCRTPTAPRRAS
ncbi:hypothetical protein WKI68_40175 [Streptomyces sp. MS1.HAVA.3]|uniref:Uncharacterized protein n=1 Tax=Streptomyces caledonius TaxID=3134107 RepID=A0ABU8UF64_9ACTN